MAGSAAEERLRSLAVAALRRERPGARICHELNMSGSGSIRLDLAAADVDHLTLVEIKSEKDKLDRLTAQIGAAHEVANSVWLIITAKHADAVLHMARGESSPYELRRRLTSTRILIENTAGELQPMTWGRNTYQFVVGEDPQFGLFPQARRQWELLWAGEMRAELAPYGFSSSMGPMTRFAVENLTGRQIRQAVCRQLRGRRFARADAPC